MFYNTHNAQTKFSDKPEKSPAEILTFYQIHVFWDKLYMNREREVITDIEKLQIIGKRLYI